MSNMCNRYFKNLWLCSGDGVVQCDHLVEKRKSYDCLELKYIGISIILFFVLEIDITNWKKELSFKSEQPGSGDASENIREQHLRQYNIIRRKCSCRCNVNSFFSHWGEVEGNSSLPLHLIEYAVHSLKSDHVRVHLHSHFLADLLNAWSRAYSTISDEKNQAD